jgi:hypothetical protein
LSGSVPEIYLVDDSDKKKPTGFCMLPEPKDGLER